MCDPGREGKGVLELLCMEKARPRLDMRWVGRGGQLALENRLRAGTKPFPLQPLPFQLQSAGSAWELDHLSDEMILIPWAQLLPDSCFYLSPALPFLSDLRRISLCHSLCDHT